MNRLKITARIAGAAFLALLGALLAVALGYTQPDTVSGTVRELNAVTVAVDGERRQARMLPTGVSGLARGAAVSVRATVDVNRGDSLYVKSVYARLKVYANGELIYENGQSRPSFLNDPATFTDLIPLRQEGDGIELRLEYAFPHDRGTLALYPPVIGPEQEIVRSLFAKMGFQFVFSLLQMLCGVILILVACCVLLFEEKGKLFLWLGLFALATGLWAFGECDFTGLLIRNPTLLYLLAFSGMFVFPVPVICFCLSMTEFRHRLPLATLLVCLLVSAAVALMLQFLGWVPLSVSMYLFHIIEPLSLIVLEGYMIHEAARKNIAARRLLLPVSVITAAVIAELLNYVLRFTDVLAVVFQSGVLVFLLLMSLAAGLYVRDAMRLRDKAQKLAFEKNLLEYRIEEQKRRNDLLMHGNEEIRRARHDMRHQLAVLRSYGANGERQKLLDYIDSLSSDLAPRSDAAPYCENPAVSAIVAHYAALAKNECVELTLRLDVPANCENISDSSLCVIFGNLMENAVEACRRMRGGRKFIVLKSRQRFGVLTITMDNSYDGRAAETDDGFLSEKHGGKGIGLHSVAEVAGNHGGGASFEAKKGVFSSSVYVQV